MSNCGIGKGSSNWVVKPADEDWLVQVRRFVSTVSNRLVRPSEFFGCVFKRRTFYRGTQLCFTALQKRRTQSDVLLPSDRPVISG